MSLSSHQFLIAAGGTLMAWLVLAQGEPPVKSGMFLRDNVNRQALVPSGTKIAKPESDDPDDGWEGPDLGPRHPPCTDHVKWGRPSGKIVTSPSFIV